MTVVLAVGAAYYRHVASATVAVVIGLVAVLLTLITLYDFSKVAASTTSTPRPVPGRTSGPADGLPAWGSADGGRRHSPLNGSRRPPASRQPGRVLGQGRPVAADGVPFVQEPAAGRAILAAVFLPPTMTLFWQKVLVSEIGVYVLLAVGLNVVVGWAGLLDLGFIAFYAIGSYTTAYLVGSLPHKPPTWLHMTPLLAIPFAIAVCLIAGIALGAPTLRLRGDYLAIVTLGFGEIIRIIAINNPGNITNSTRGPSPAVAHPSIHIGPLHITWGLNNLQYWYLLLVFIVIVVVLFYRLEGSRLGRAWAAIREDEVAAQASGDQHARVKLMAFAIGASTSGVAGVFFASQIGYFNPDNFVLNNSILVVAYVVFGGMGSLPGAMAGAAVLTWLPEFLKDQVPGADRQMWIGAVVLLMMIFRPAGLIPAANGARLELRGLARIRQAETARGAGRRRDVSHDDRRRRPVSAPDDIVFDVDHVTLRFGGVTSLNDVSLQMFRGEILAVIGPNGAGKTSLFNSLTGVYTPQEGSITLSGRPGASPVSVLGKKTHVINHLGVARTFQNIRLFPR